MANKLPKAKIAVSACLMGENVRYNGGNTKLDWITSQLPQIFDLEGFCPELMMGMGVPREAIRIVYDESDKKKLIGTQSGKDYTDDALMVAKKVIKNFKDMGIQGIIWQTKSPSCGMERVKLYNEKSMFSDRRGKGIVMEIVQEHFPELPMADSGRLHHPPYRENFIRKVEAYIEFEEMEKTIFALESFHRRYKYILMELNPKNQKELGQIIASFNRENLDSIWKTYQRLFFSTFDELPLPGRRLNVFQHLFGYLKKNLESSEKGQIINLFELYRMGRVSYKVPLELLKFLIGKYQITYLLDQKYLSPAYHAIEIGDA